MTRKRKHSTRNKFLCRQTKYNLIAKYGTTCWLCEGDPGSRITHHHIKPHHNGGSDTEDNGALLCEDCQKWIHKYEYLSDMYEFLTSRLIKNSKKILSNRHP